MISLDEFESAYELIKPYVDPTPLRYSLWLSKELDAEVYLKLENLNAGRSFKIRGATYSLLAREKLPTKVITASGGNHGLGVAIASARMNIPCLVVLPTSTSNYRIQLLKDLGAEVQLKGDAWDEANEYALQLAQDYDKLYIHPFADREVMVGQGTISLEIRDQLQKHNKFRELRTVTASVGGGGLLAGIALAFEAMNHKSTIVAVETKGADSLAQSLEHGKLIKLKAITSIAKTLGAKTTTPFIFETMQRLVDKIVVIEDAFAVKTMFDILEHEKVLVEPATSCSVAAALQHPELFRDRVSVIVICGSNISYTEALNWKKQFGI